MTSEAALPTLQQIAAVWPLGAMLFIVLILVAAGYWKIYRPEAERLREARKEETKAREAIAVATQMTAASLASAAECVKDTSLSLENHGQYLKDELQRLRTSLKA